MKVLEKDYLYYISNLIRWKEYGLVNIVINDNFPIFPLEIIDDITQKDIEKKIVLLILIMKQLFLKEINNRNRSN